MVSKEDLENWIVETLSKPNPIFNNLPPCPYAKKAWLDGKVLSGGMLKTTLINHVGVVLNLVYAE